MLSKSKSKTHDMEKAPESKVAKLPLWRKTLLGLVAIGSAGGIAWGYNQMTREDNWEDFMTLKEFTSADHQEDRCEVQAAVDAQETMRQHFEEKGGLAPEEAELMAPIVGLTPDQITDLLTTKLFKFSYDCIDDNGIASTQEATFGLTAASAGAGILGGVLVGATLAYRRPRES